MKNRALVGFELTTLYLLNRRVHRLTQRTGKVTAKFEEILVEMSAKAVED